MDGWMGGWRAGHGLANMVFGDFCFCGVPFSLGFRGDRFGEGESLLKVWCLYLNAENADSSLTLSYLRVSSQRIDMLLGMPIGVALGRMCHHLLA